MLCSVIYVSIALWVPSLLVIDLLYWWFACLGFGYFTCFKDYICLLLRSSCHLSYLDTGLLWVGALNKYGITSEFFLFLFFKRNNSFWCWNKSCCLLQNSFGFYIYMHNTATMCLSCQKTWMKIFDVRVCVVWYCSNSKFIVRVCVVWYC